MISWPTVAVIGIVAAAAVAFAALHVSPELLAALAIAGTTVAGAMRAAFKANGGAPEGERPAVLPGGGDPSAPPPKTAAPERKEDLQ